MTTTIAMTMIVTMIMTMIMTETMIQTMTKMPRRRAVGQLWLYDTDLRGDFTLTKMAWNGQLWHATTFPPVNPPGRRTLKSRKYDKLPFKPRPCVLRQ